MRPDGCIPNIPLKRIVDQMKSKCPLGCGQMITPEMRKTHTITQCPRRLVECANSSQCGIFEAQDLTKHLQNQCLFRKVPCSQNCQAWLTLPEVEEHLMRYCPNTVVHCPNGCERNMKQLELEEHMDSCPLQQIPCEYAIHGCKDTMLRSEVGTHAEEHTQEHLRYLAMSFGRQQEELYSLRHQIQNNQRIKIDDIVENGKVILQTASTFVCERSGNWRQKYAQISYETLFLILGILFIAFLIPGLFKLFLIFGGVSLARRYNVRRPPKWALILFILFFIFFVLL